MKVQNNQPTIPNPANFEKPQLRTAERDSKASATRSTPATDPSISTSERQSKLAERGIAENYMRDQLIGAGEAAKLRSVPSDPANRITDDPREQDLSGYRDPFRAGVIEEARGEKMRGDGWGPIGEGSMDIVVKAPSGDDRPDLLDGSLSPEEQFEQAANDRLSQRSAGGTPKDSNSQSDGDPLAWAGLTFVGFAGAVVSGPVGVAAAAAAAVVGGLNYVYDAIIEDQDSQVPDPVEAEPVPVGDGGGGDVSDQTETEATLEYVLENPDETQNGTQNPDDTSGDNPNPGWTPDLTPRTSVADRDTVSTPADPYRSELSAEEIQARIDALGRFSPRTQNAINPGDGDGEVGGDPYAGEPADLPDVDPVGDPGSPDGPGEPTA